MQYRCQFTKIIINWSSKSVSAVEPPVLEKCHVFDKVCGPSTVETFIEGPIQFGLPKTNIFGSDYESKKSDIYVMAKIFHKKELEDTQYTGKCIYTRDEGGSKLIGLLMEVGSELSSEIDAIANMSLISNLVINFEFQLTKDFYELKFEDEEDEIFSWSFNVEKDLTAD